MSGKIVLWGDAMSLEDLAWPVKPNPADGTLLCLICNKPVDSVFRRTTPGKTISEFHCHGDTWIEMNCE